MKIGERIFLIVLFWLKLKELVMVSTKFHVKVYKGFLKIANNVIIKIKKIIDFFKKFFFKGYEMIKRSSCFNYGN